MNKQSDRIILLGAAPSRDSDPTNPLVPGRNKRGTGGSLLRLLQMDVDSFCVAFERHYLIPIHPGRNRGGDNFPVRLVREGVERMGRIIAGRTVVLVGKKVACAFGVDHLPPFEWVQSTGASAGASTWASVGASMAWVPNPCGINTWWNDPENKRAGETFLVALGRRAFDLSLRRMAS
ncbi:MAG: hypothetical protein H7836_16035 [Magnetococcus sp. YQC-3]